MRTSDTRDLILFFGLAIFLTFAATLLPLLPDLIQVVMVFLPTILAVLITLARSGGAGVRNLLRRSFDWRRPIQWYLVAVGLAFFLRLLISLTALLLGWISTVQVRAWSPAQMAAFAIAVFIFAQLEEIGWRGYALSRLLTARSALFSALLIGILWGTAHVALTLPGMTMQTLPPWVVIGQILGLSLIITWLFIVSKGSVIITALFHAAQTFFVIVNEGISLEQNGLLMALLFPPVGLALILSYALRHQQNARQEIPVA